MKTRQRLHPRVLASVVFATVTLAAVSVGRPATAAIAEIPPDLADRVANLLPSVAVINTVASSPQGSMYFRGSGFVVDPSGYIATNRHVIASAYQITVTLPDFPPLSAKAVFISSRLDLALLKVDAGKPLPAVKLGDSDTVRVGDSVLLIGNPLGVGRSLSTGVVSGVNRDINETMYDHFIQTDAALNHGNSGGPMFNLKGEVIAVNSALQSSPGNTGSIGIGYSLPINDVKFVIEQYMKTGQVEGGTVGVRGQRITQDLAAAFGMDKPIGAIVTEVDPKGPAAGKIKNGDIILRVENQDASDMPAVARLVAFTPPGQKLQFTLLRDGVEQIVEVPVVDLAADPKYAMSVLGRAPNEMVAFATPSNPGMTFAALTDPIRKKYMLQSTENGVVVTAVNKNSAAEQLQISEGYVVELVGDRQVNQPEDVQPALKALSDQHKSFAPLLIRGEQGPRWVALRLDPDR